MGWVRWVAVFWLCSCGGSGSSAVDAGGGDATPGRTDASEAITVVDESYLADLDPDLANPERGIYYWSVQADDPHTLIAEWLYLGSVCDQNLVWAGRGAPTTSPVLEAYADALVAHRNAGRKVVFRPRYDVPGDDGLNSCGVFHADTWARQLNHVDAIAAMLGEYKEVIAFVEAGYLGRWGEWNTSGFDPSNAPFLTDAATRRDLMAYVLAAYASAGLDRFVELRRPVFAKEVLDADASAAVGLYNDCFMTNDSDQGTYSNYESNNPANFASTAEAKAWAEDHTAAAPFGGETCPWSGARWESCSNMVGPSSEPAGLHLSYLHGAWAPDARATWEAGGCYDDIKRSLGYRFEVVQVEYPPAVASGQSLRIRVTVRNTGWARMHNPRSAVLVLRSDDTEHAITPDSGAAVHDWLPGQKVTVTAAAAPPAPGSYRLSLRLADPDAPDVIAYAVRLASLRDGAPVFDDQTGDNDLGVDINVAAQ